MKKIILIILMAFLLIGCAPALSALMPVPSLELDPNVTCLLARNGDLVEVELKATEHRTNTLIAVTTNGSLGWPEQVLLERTLTGAAGRLEDLVMNVPYIITLASPERTTADTAQTSPDGKRYRTECRPR